MDSKKYIVLVLLPLIAALCSTSFVQGSSQGENDMTTMVNWVIDGDTFNVTTGETIRLADIDAPEWNHTGYGAAKSLLISLAYNKTVYLDIDDLSRTDPYGRLICVAYVDYNLTHVKNINKALLTEGVVIVNNYTNNEFNPSTWTLYVSRMVVPEFPNLMSLGIVMTASAFVIFLFQRYRARGLDYAEFFFLENPYLLKNPRRRFYRLQSNDQIRISNVVCLLSIDSRWLS